MERASRIQRIVRIESDLFPRVVFDGLIRRASPNRHRRSVPDVSNPRSALRWSNKLFFI
jgi:hypothetical protein